MRGRGDKQPAQEPRHPWHPCIPQTQARTSSVSPPPPGLPSGPRPTLCPLPLALTFSCSRTSQGSRNNPSALSQPPLPQRYMDDNSAGTGRQTYGSDSDTRGFRAGWRRKFKSKGKHCCYTENGTVKVVGRSTEFPFGEGLSEPKAPRCSPGRAPGSQLPESSEAVACLSRSQGAGWCPQCPGQASGMAPRTQGVLSALQVGTTSRCPSHHPRRKDSQQ